MHRLRTSIPLRPASPLRRALDLVDRYAPVVIVVTIMAVFAAQQIVKPGQRVVKAGVMLALIGLMLRYDMVYSVYLFVLLFVFPSGVSFGSTNMILMTLIPLVWMVRATSNRLALVRRTSADWAIITFLLAHLISLYAVTDSAMMPRNLVVVWRACTAAAFFYTIVTFVDSEEKLMRLGKIVCVSCALVMSTAIIELFAPGSTLIPGWISLSHIPGQGQLGYRLKGIRVGGAFDSHGMLADFGTQLILFMVFYAIRARNPAEKTAWILATAMTVVAILATANRGATAGFALAMLLAMVFFHRRVGTARTFLLAVTMVVGVFVADTILSKHTLAVSVFNRFEHTTFQGMVPDNRTMTWKPALMDALTSPYIGHGPFYDVGIGLSKRYWPHNGYLFYFCTLGIIGLGAFLWVVWCVWRESRWWRHGDIRSTPLGDFMALAQIWLFVLLFEQMRTDHQRDDIYPYIVWMCFGVVVAGAMIARNKLRAQETVTSGS